VECGEFVLHNIVDLIDAKLVVLGKKIEINGLEFGKNNYMYLTAYQIDI
jgi:hypothetical protein